MNWKRIALYAIALLVAQAAIGFLESSFASTNSTVLIASSAISFVVCSAIFAHLAVRQSFRPFVHAWTALILQILAGAILLLALTGRLGSAPCVTLAIEWLVLVCSLVAGTALGLVWRRRTEQPAGA